MAASGVINGTTSNPYIVVKIEWRLFWQDLATNVSAVEAILYARRTNTGYVTSGTGSFTVSINGAASTTSGYVEIGTEWVQIGSNALQVAHEVDGTKQINVSASGSIPVAGLTSISVGGTVALDTIPRASTPTLSATSFDMGTAVTISTNRASSGFRHKLRILLGYRTQEISDVGASTSWTMPVDWANQVATDTSRQGTLICETYSGGTKIGEKSIIFTARVPASVVPTIGALTVSDPKGHAPNFGGQYVQNFSQAQAVIGTSSGVHGSTITGYRLELATTVIADQTGTFDLPTDGSVTIKATVTDSRGRTATRSTTITVAAYSPPAISTFTISRVTAGGAADDMGSYVRVQSAGSATDLPDNTLTWAVQQADGAAWNNLTTGSDAAAPLAWSDNSVLGGGGIDPLQSYQIRVVATDLVTTTTRIITLPTGAVTMAWAKRAVGIGKVPERGALDVAGDAYTSGRFYEDGLGLDHLYGVGAVCYDYTNGYLIETDIGLTDDIMWTLDIRRNTDSSYQSRQSGMIWAQGHAYAEGSAIIKCAAVSTVGPLEMRVFFGAGGTMQIWLPFWVPHETLHFRLGGTTGSMNRRIINLTDSGLPGTRTREQIITARTIGYDTGWLPLPATGRSHTLTENRALQYRIIDGVCHLRGTIHRDPYGGFAVGATYTIGTIPGCDATQRAGWSLYSEPSTIVTQVQVAAGAVRLRVSAAGNAWVILGGSFPTT